MVPRDQKGTTRGCDPLMDKNVFVEANDKFTISLNTHSFIIHVIPVLTDYFYFFIGLMTFVTHLAIPGTLRLLSILIIILMNINEGVFPGSSTDVGGSIPQMRGVMYSQGNKRFQRITFTWRITSRGIMIQYCNKKKNHDR